MDEEIRKITNDLMRDSLEDATKLYLDQESDAPLAMAEADIPMIASMLYMSRWELIMKQAKEGVDQSGKENQ